MESLEKALESFRPTLEARFKDMVKTIWNNAIKQHGLTLKGVYNDRRFARSFGMGGIMHGLFRGKTNRTNAEKYLDQSSIDRKAVEYADATVSKWKGKLKSKLEEIESVQVEYLDGLRFTIHGKRAGHDISITQDVILKCSTKGTLFNQFPSRIYVDGKFTPEKKYKEMFGN
jgi:tetrahydromethanopterin S-methyltransferase subunit G